MQSVPITTKIHLNFLLFALLTWLIYIQICLSSKGLLVKEINLFTPRYSWNFAKIGISPQSIKSIKSYLCRMKCSKQSILPTLLYKCSVRVFNTTFSNISDISWQSVLLMEETGAHGDIDLLQVTDKLCCIVYTLPKRDSNSQC